MGRPKGSGVKHGMRRCLKCRKPFPSKGDRLCWRCNKENETIDVYVPYPNPLINPRKY